MYAFDPIISENFLTKIEVQELREENTSLVGEVQRLRIYLEQSHGGSSLNEQIQSHFTQLDQRFDQKIGILQ
jgi:FtsZ-binding cell division protein ZapB